MRVTRLVGCALVLIITAASTRALAQDEPVDRKGTGGVLQPSASITETRDATSLSINPANIALLDSWSLAYVGAWVGDQRNLAGQGHGGFFAFPIGPLGLGVSIEALTPPDPVLNWQGLDARARFSVGLGFQIQRAFALGIAYRTFWAYGAGDIDTVDLGLTIAPINYLALSLVASDLNAPKLRYISAERAARRLNVGLTVRPLGRDVLAVGGELSYHYTDNWNRTDLTGIVTARLFGGVGLRARFGVQSLRGDDFNRGYFLDGALTLDLPHIGLTGSSYGQVGPKGSRGYQGTSWKVALSGERGPYIDLPRALRPTRAVLLEIDKPLENAKLARFSQLLARIAGDEDVDLVVFKPKAGVLSLEGGFELRRRIEALQEAGRKVVCDLDEATRAVYLMCAGADQIWVNPGGGVRMAGLAMPVTFFGELLSKVGVNADIVRIGEYKSAPESYTRTSPSEPAAEQIEQYVDSAYQHIVSSVARGRGWDWERAREVIEDGPYTAGEALEAGLADELVPDDLFDAKLREWSGGAVVVDSRYAQAIWHRERYLDAPAVAVVHIDGDIVDGETMSVPLLDVKMVGSETVKETLRRIKADPTIRAVVLRINSSGGSALASEKIWREVMALRKVKPVIASLGPVAASGGYYIASAAHVIYAEPVTLTGSIGIFYGKADVSGLLDKVGVDVTMFKRGPHADMSSWTRPYTPKERERLMAQIKEYYDLFLERVVEGRGRGFTTEIVDKLGRGRIWSGQRARELLLVDEFGGYMEALDEARARGEVPEDIAVSHYTGESGSLLGLVLDAMSSVTQPGLNRETRAWSLLATQYADLMAAALRLGTGSALAPRARLPFVFVENLE